MENRPDIIDTLENELVYHQQQVDKIKAALLAIKGHPQKQNVLFQGEVASVNRIEWSREIREVFSAEQGSLSIRNVKNRLSQKGIQGVEEIKNRNIISNTIIRLAADPDGFLEKVTPGVYRRRGVATESRVNDPVVSNEVQQPIRRIRLKRRDEQKSEG